VPRSFLSKLAIVATSFSLALSVLTSAAWADIGWIVQPQSVLGATAKITLPAFDIANPENPDPNSDTYVPPIVITSVPQTDPGTSGDPALGKAAINSLFGSGTGYFTTLGNTPTTSLNFGTKSRPHADGDLTIEAVPIGKFLPSSVDGVAQPPTFDANGQPVFNFGAPTLSINAATLQTQSPLTGYNALTGNDFSQSSRDNGRIAGTALKAVPYSAGAIPVAAGSFDATKLSFWGALGASISLAVAADPNSIEGVAPLALVATTTTFGPQAVANQLAGATGTITRSGPDYILTAPFTNTLILQEDSPLQIPLDITLVAKANIVEGDANFDGVVNIQDITLIANKWLTKDLVHKLGQGDVNGDGTVDIQDVTMAANHWLQTPPALGGGGSVTAVPEPGSLVLLGCGAVCAILVVRRHGCC